MIKTKPRLLWVLIVALSCEVPAYAYGVSTTSQKSLKVIPRNSQPVAQITIAQNTVNQDNNKTATNDKINTQTPAKTGRALHQIKEIVVSGTQKTADEKGYDEVFTKNVSNVYIGKEYLERYRVDSSGEVLKGLNGVYNMNTRVASAITPNIRGIAGKGRIPLTIDGTEQTVDVWLNNYGTGDRNYVDPYLFRSIAVEKSPALTRGMKTSVGGGVAIKTIEPEDVIPQGKKWGIGFKVETAGNTIKPAVEPSEYFYIPDYRDIPGAVGSIHSSMTIPINMEIKQKSYGDILNFQDNSALLTLGFKTELTDGLMAYSYRQKGNYFAGKSGVAKYHNNYLPLDEWGMSHVSGSYFPNMAKIISPHDEVMNTSTKTKTLLLKNNWYLPNEQKIGLQYTRMNSDFAEISPIWSSIVLGLVEEAPEIMLAFPRQMTRSRSNINSDTYKLSYDWKPQDSRWLNLEANLWKHKSNSERHQSGGADFFTIERDHFYDYWMLCNHYGIAPRYTGPTVCDEMARVKQAPRRKADYPNGFTVYPGSLQNATSTRKGFDISNQFNWSDSFKLTLAADIQHENLNEYSFLNRELEWLVLPAVQGATKMAGPRTGRRHEWGGNISFDWQVTDKLNMVAGLRYHNFWAFDDEVARQRQQRNEMFAKGSQRIGYKLEYQQLATDEEAEIARIADSGPWLEREPAREKLRDIAKNKYGQEHARLGGGHSNSAKMVYYWAGFETFVPMKNNKLLAADNIFYNGQANFEEMVENPYGVQGSFRRYKVQQGCGEQENYKPTSCGMDEVLKELDNKDNYASPDHLRGHAWSPMIAISYDIVNNGRLFARYAQATRFPSAYESFTTGYNPIRNTYFSTELKPERSRNWEVGYTHDFSAYFQRAKADARITYYNTNIKNVIDTPTLGALMQFEHKIHSGIELQSRFDNGGYFANLGATYRLQQKMCDKSYGMLFNMYNVNRRLECIQGGFGATKSFNNMQPKYSINLDLGARRFNDKLELGTRAIYHGPVDNKQMNQLTEEGFGGATITTGVPYFWHPAWVIDVYGRYNFNKDIAVKFSINNITDKYYLDPLASVPIPAPGRSLSIGLEGKF